MDHNFEVRESMVEDVRAFYDQQLDPESQWMAAFTPEDPSDRDAYMKKWRKILADDSYQKRTIVVDGAVAGHVIIYPSEGQLEVTFWIGRRFWGHGLAQRALAQLLSDVPTRPLIARTAHDNEASKKVLQHNGFLFSHDETFFANARGAPIVENVYELF